MGGCWKTFFLFYDHRPMNLTIFQLTLKTKSYKKMKTADWSLVNKWQCVKEIFGLINDVGISKIILSLKSGNCTKYLNYYCTMLMGKKAIKPQ